MRTDSEPEGLFDTLIQTDLKRPDAVVKIQKDALTMETVALDISVTSTTSVSGEGRVTHKGSVGKAAQDKFREKMTKYHTLCAERGVRFVPIVMETCGYIHPTSKQFLEELASIGESTRNIGKKTLLSYFVKLLVTCLNRHLADNITRLARSTGNYAFPLLLEQMHLMDDAVANHNTVITGVDLLA